MSLHLRRQAVCNKTKHLVASKSSVIYDEVKAAAELGRIVFEFGVLCRQYHSSILVPFQAGHVSLHLCQSLARLISFLLEKLRSYLRSLFICLQPLDLYLKGVDAADVRLYAVNDALQACILLRQVVHYCLLSETLLLDGLQATVLILKLLYPALQAGLCIRLIVKFLSELVVVLFVACKVGLVGLGDAVFGSESGQLDLEGLCIGGAGSGGLFIRDSTL